VTIRDLYRLYLYENTLYTVEITGVESDGKKLTVTVTVTKPTGFATTVLTQPYHIVKLKKTDLPVEFVWTER
jgi:2',3'-cyclic-nucleotide 2'-phosphodiesterase (5'-nucleotidase family)